MASGKKKVLSGAEQDNPAMAFIDAGAGQRAAQEPEDVVDACKEEAPADAVQASQETRRDVINRRLRGEFKAPEGYRLSRFVESRSRRLQTLLPPTVHDELKAWAKKEKVSVNELINCILADALEK